MGTIALAPLGGGIDHPEGVCWDPDGAVIVGTEAGGLLWLDPADGSVMRSVTIGSGLVAGIAVDGDGRVVACDVPGHRVARVDRRGLVETFTTGPAEGPLRTPNYPVFTADGRLFVSDSGAWGAADGRVIVVETDGTSRVLSDGPSAFTNGMALAPDGRHLYVVESSLPGISRLPLLPDGSAGPRELVVTMPRTVPDGIAFTADGLLLITCYRPDAVFLWDGSRLDTLVEDWTGLLLSAPTNLAFTGHGLDQLVSANLGGWHVTRIDAGLVGAPLHHPHRA
jgi:gluconolactonase